MHSPTPMTGLGKFVMNCGNCRCGKTRLCCLSPTIREPIRIILTTRWRAPHTACVGWRCCSRTDEIDVPASQIDIAATLLYQLGIDHSEFIFSKNMLNPASPHFGYFTEPSFFGMVTDTNQLVYNLDGEKVMLDEGSEKGRNLLPGKAFLQKLYDDLDKR